MEAKIARKSSSRRKKLTPEERKAINAAKPVGNKYVEAAYTMFKKFFSVVNELDPDFNRGHAYMALCCYDLGKNDEFLEYLQKSVEMNPHEAKLVLGFLFPQGMEPSEYAKYMETRIKKQ